MDDNDSSSAADLAGAKVRATYREFQPVPADAKESGDQDELVVLDAAAIDAAIDCRIPCSIRFCWTIGGEEPHRPIIGRAPSIVAQGQIRSYLDDYNEAYADRARAALGHLAANEPGQLLNQNRGRIEIPGFTCRCMSVRPCHQCSLGRQRCPACNATGRQSSSAGTATGMNCSTCGGTGRTYCGLCNGTGQLRQVGEGGFVADVNPSFSVEPPGAAEHLRGHVHNLTGKRFAREFGPLELQSAPDKTTARPIILRARQRLIHGRYRSCGRVYPFSYFAGTGQWIQRPMILDPLAQRLADDIERVIARNQQALTMLEQLEQRWPVLGTLLRQQAREPDHSAWKQLSSQCEGLVSDSLARRITAPLVRLHQEAAPRTTVSYWVVVTLLFSALAAVFAPEGALDPGRENMAPAVATILGFGLLAAYGGAREILTRRNKRVPHHLQRRHIDTRMLVGAMAVTAVCGGTAIKEGDPYGDLRERILVSTTAVLPERLIATSTPTPELSILQVQHALRRLGHYRGALDGIDGPNTRAARSAFEVSRGRTADARFDSADRRALLRAWRITEIERALRTRGVDIGRIDGRADRELEQGIRAVDIEAPPVVGPDRGQGDRYKQIVIALGGQAMPPGAGTSASSR